MNLILIILNKDFILNIIVLCISKIKKFTYLTNSKTLSQEKNEIGAIAQMVEHLHGMQGVRVLPLAPLNFR